ncbi:MAG: glycerophosphodiester phosphodiesterase [Actinomycetota bacterium]
MEHGQQLNSVPAISWHRGGSELEPSASRAAFVAALRHGAEIVEIDVRSTADGELVCVHDERLEELGVVADLNFQELSSNQQAQIYTLHEFVADLVLYDPLAKTTVHFDLKERGHEVEAVDRLLEQHRPLFVTTLIDESVVLLRRERPAVPTYLTIGASTFGKSKFQSLRQRIGELIPFRRIRASGANGIAIHYALARPRTLRWCAKRNLAVVVWTVDRSRDLSTWLLRDIAVLTTNRPLRALELRAELSSEP